jgi:hypothetical protein
MYGIYTNIGGILMVNVTIYDIHGSYGHGKWMKMVHRNRWFTGLPGLPMKNGDFPWLC